MATIGAGSGYAVGSPNAATVTIQEAPASVSVQLHSGNTTTMEGSGSPGTMMVGSTTMLTSDLTVYYAVSGTATGGLDYQTLTGSIVIPAGQDYATINVYPLDDGGSDDNLSSEYVTVTLSTGAGYTIGSPNSATVTIEEGNYETLSVPPKTVAPAAGDVTVGEVRALLPAAALRWEEAGVPASLIVADLRGVRIDVADLPGSIVGEGQAANSAAGRPGTISIDFNAAGYGWFIDRTPLDDSEFPTIVAPSERQASGGPASGRVDLLTVLMHEMGHLFGLPDLPVAADPYDIMADTLDLSTRRWPMPGTMDAPPSVPTATDANRANAADAAFLDFGSDPKHAIDPPVAHVARENPNCLSAWLRWPV